MGENLSEDDTMKDIHSMTRAQIIREHRKMWNWIADETLKKKRKVDKDEYFEKYKKKYRNQPRNDCFLCEYNIVMQNSDCDSCLINWDSAGNRNCMNTLYGEWVRINYDCYKYAAEVAREIANLPEKKVCMKLK